MTRGSRFLSGAVALALLSAAPAWAIGFIDSPTAYCRKVKGGTCAINWYYISVNASPNYVVDLRIELGAKVVYHAHGFFQTSMYIPGADALGDGILVKCGPAGENVDDSDPDNVVSYGTAYSWAIRARDSANLKSANYGTVVCPPK